MFTNHHWHCVRKGDLIQFNLFILIIAVIGIVWEVVHVTIDTVLCFVQLYQQRLNSNACVCAWILNRETALVATSPTFSSTSLSVITIAMWSPPPPSSPWPSSPTWLPELSKKQWAAVITWFKVLNIQHTFTSLGKIIVLPSSPPQEFPRTLLAGTRRSPGMMTKYRSRYDDHQIYIEVNENHSDNDENELLGYREFLSCAPQSRATLPPVIMMIIVI